jgi:hypothetical protein
MSNPELVQMRCPQCDGGVEFPADGIGQRIACPHCQAEFALKRPATKRRFVVASICFIVVCVAVVFDAFVLWHRPKDHTLSKPRKTEVPITGAFGFTLGEKLPQQFNLEDGYCFVNDYSDAPPFTTIQLCCLADRTIYEIIGHGYSNSFEVLDALKLKYGQGSWDYSTNFANSGWFNADCILNALLTGKNHENIEVDYLSFTLRQRKFDESDKASHAAVTNLAPKL